MGRRMTTSAGLILIGLVLLVVGGEALLRGAVGLATLLRVSPAVIGLAGRGPHWPVKTAILLSPREPERFPSWLLKGRVREP